jgi:lipoprotein-releasing system permease protein
MYKLLLCWRYLRTRYIALASIISVTLGVATMIVVNSVMTGFTREMQGRIHGILSDVVFESHSMEGFHDAERHMRKIREVAGPYIAGMTPTVVVPAMLAFDVQGQTITRQISFIGVDEKSHDQVSDFSRYLQHPANRQRLSFLLREDGYDTRDHQAGGEAIVRERMEYAGWVYRRIKARQRAEMEARLPRPESPSDGPANPFETAEAEQEQHFDPAKEQHTGIVLGFALGSYRLRDGADRFLVMPGDDVKVMVPSAGTPPKPISGEFTIVDFYESKMSEYDANFVFVPIRTLQEMRGMIDPQTGIGNVTSIQIKLHDDADGAKVRDLLQAAFPAQIYSVQTWRDKQGPLLAAAQLETNILNLLLFLIIAVAGFGILAIFFMIVVEKTRDIGILKSLGAPSRGILGIFLGYGLSLGVVGSGAGLAIGLLFVAYINDIADALAWVTGQEVFDPSIYYFQQIPTIVEPLTVTWIVAGAMVIAVLASIMPARRAARLHPVEALRYE